MELNLLARDIRAAVSLGKISGEIVEHPETDGAKSADAARALGLPEECILKSLVLVPEKEGKGVPVVAILLGPDKLNLKKFPEHRLCPIDRLSGVVGATIGEIPPVLLPIPVILDRKVLLKETVAGSAGTRFSGIKLAPSEIRKGNKVCRVADISA